MYKSHVQSSINTVPHEGGLELNGTQKDHEIGRDKMTETQSTGNYITSMKCTFYFVIIYCVKMIKC